MTALSVHCNHLEVWELPEWLRERTVERVARYTDEHGAGPGWRVLMAMAIDESNTPAAHRSVLRTLVSFKPESDWAISTISTRSGTSAKQTKRILDDLDSWGWLHRRRRHGAKTKYTLLVPVAPPPDRLHRRRPRNPDGANQHEKSSTTEVAVTSVDGSDKPVDESDRGHSDLPDRGHGDLTRGHSDLPTEVTVTYKVREGTQGRVQVRTPPTDSVTTQERVA